MNIKDHKIFPSIIQESDGKNYFDCVIIITTDTGKIKEIEYKHPIPLEEWENIEDDINQEIVRHLKGKKHDPHIYKRRHT